MQVLIPESQSLTRFGRFQHLLPQECRTLGFPFNGGKGGFLFDHPQSLALILFLTQQGFICGVIPPFLTQITRTITHRNKRKGQLAQRQRGVCCRFYYYYKFHQESLLTCGSNSGKAYFLPAEAPCLCLSPDGAEGAAPPWCPRGSGGPTAGEPHTHPRNSGRRGKGRAGERPTAGPDRGAAGSSPVLGTPWRCPCPNLTFIEKSIRHRGPLSNLPENTMGRGR